MTTYETMFIVRPDLTDEKRDAICKDIASIVDKNNGKVINQQVWAQKRKMIFNIRKYDEGTYYLLQFDINTPEVVKLRQAWKLNEDILRFQILQQAAE